MQSDQLYLATAHWCDHCKDQKQVIANDDTLASNIEVVECARKDANGTDRVLTALEEAVCGGVQGFPSWVKDGEIVAVGGGKDADNLCSNDKLLKDKC